MRWAGPGAGARAGGSVVVPPCQPQQSANLAGPLVWACLGLGLGLGPLAITKHFSIVNSRFYSQSQQHHFKPKSSVNSLRSIPHIGNK